MYMIAVTAEMKPGKAAEVGKKWKEFYSSRWDSVPGFEHAHWGHEDGTDKTMAVVILEQRPGEDELRQLMQEFGPTVSHLTAGPPTVEWYEILEQI